MTKAITVATEKLAQTINRIRILTARVPKDATDAPDALIDAYFDYSEQLMDMHELVLDIARTRMGVLDYAPPLIEIGAVDMADRGISLEDALGLATDGYENRCALIAACSGEAQ